MAIGKDFILGGHAIFTVENNKGEHYTYRVTCPEDRRVYFLALLTGPDNTHDYTYMGLLDKDNGNIQLRGKTKFTPEATSYKVALWALRSIVWGGKALPDGYKIHHEGRCGKCGRLLTVPESIESGIGPVCAGREAA